MPDDYYVSQYSGEEIDELLGGAGSATGAVRYDAAQTLTDEQKAQARANIAAAPDGFGLGANGNPNPYTVVTGATIDTLNESGLFWYRDADTPIYPDGYNSGTVGNLLNVVGNRNNTFASRQIFYPYHPYGGVALDISCMRMRTDAGEWQPWEWVNPPMILGVEYRTTERYLGKAVYVRLVNFGALGNATTKSVDVAVENTDKIPVLGGTALEIPLIPGAYNGAISGISATRTSAKITISITTTADLSWMQAEVLLGYTKTTN